MTAGASPLLPRALWLGQPSHGSEHTFGVMKVGSASFRISDFWFQGV